ncbi:hypothetical protein OF897_16565 [Chryseobacterium formosus]|uniref:Lipoprotein n=1 Tax=Chryseobacterium formosus TaxID=1537363 RepID=A0ABT3XV33_9FLAO|nr:hypothetical protein [Chryseobacterium formosus]MCX8525527.1 hypothetical protein [Chryseobacterium formosus]
MRRIIIVLMLIVTILNSCRSEHIELRSRNAVKIYDNELKIKIVPCKNRMIVKAVYHAPIIERRQNSSIKIISNKKVRFRKIYPKHDYFKIIECFENIDEELMRFPKTSTDSNGIWTLQIGPMDAEFVSIKYKKGRYKKDVFGRSMSPLYGYFFTTSEMILEKAQLELKDLDR